MSNTTRGALWMLGTILSFSIMAISGREMSGSLDTFEIMMYRSALGLLIVCSVISASGNWHQIKTHHLKLHFLRNFVHFTGQNLWFFALTVIPLAQVFALEFTTPLWVILLSPLLLGEKFTRTKAICAVLGFIGILVITRPGSTPINVGVITAASCAIFFALTIMFTKRLTSTDSISCILFYLTSIQLGFGFLAAGYDLDIAVPSVSALPHIIAIGLGGLAAHFCYTKALQAAPATIVSPIDFGRLPAIALAGWLVYSEPLDALVFIGAGIIFAGNYYNIWTETRRSKA